MAPVLQIAAAGAARPPPRSAHTYRHNVARIPLRFLQTTLTDTGALLNTRPHAAPTVRCAGPLPPCSASLAWFNLLWAGTYNPHLPTVGDLAHFIVGLEHIPCCEPSPPPAAASSNFPPGFGLGWACTCTPPPPVPHRGVAVRRHGAAGQQALPEKPVQAPVHVLGVVPAGVCLGGVLHS